MHFWGGASYVLESGGPLYGISIMLEWKSDDLILLYLHILYPQQLTAQQYLNKHLPCFYYPYESVFTSLPTNPTLDLDHSGPL